MNMIKQLFDAPTDLLDLEAEELAAVILPYLPTDTRAAFSLTDLINDLYPASGGGFPALSHHVIEGGAVRGTGVSAAARAGV